MIKQIITSLSFFFIFNGALVSSCDAADNWQLGLQDPATPMMEGILNFHNHLMFLVGIGILLLVTWPMRNVIFV